MGRRAQLLAFCRVKEARHRRTNSVISLTGGAQNSQMQKESRRVAAKTWRTGYGEFVFNGDNFCSARRERSGDEGGDVCTIG